MDKYFGFDLLIFEECVEFAMEICEPVKLDDLNPYALYENLAILHQLKLIHQDIKPENIMYSPSFKRLIFIDYGLSRFIS